MKNVDRIPAHQPKRASEEAARIEARRLREVVTETTDFIGQATPDTKLTYVNKAGRRGLGWTPDEDITGKTITDVHPPEIVDYIVREALPKANQNGTWSGETAIIDSNGNTVPCSHVIIAHTGPDGSVELYSSVMRDISEDRTAQNELYREKELQRIVAEIAQCFVSVDSTTVDAVIDKTLTRLGTFFEIDRVGVMRVHASGDTVSCTHEWCRPGVPPKRESMQNIPVSAAPWYARIIGEQKEVVHVPDVRDLPPEAAAGRRLLEDAGVVSALSIPLFTDATVHGFFGFEMVRTRRRWSDTEIQDLRVIAQLLSTSLERIETQSKLERSEALLRETERLAKIGSWEANLETEPAAVNWSAETYRILELDSAETEPSFEAFLAVVDPDERDAVREAYETSVAEGGEFERVSLLCPVSGRTKHVRISCVTRYSAAGAPLRSVGTIQDMTRITTLERDLVERTEALESSLTATAIAKPDGTLTYVNRAFLELWGADSREEVIGTNVLQFHPDETDAQMIAEVSAGGAWSGEIQAQKRDGTTFTALTSASVVRSADGAVRSMVASFTDITQRKTVELQARAHAEKFRSLVNSTMEGYWLVDLDARFLEVNDVACRMLGYTREEMLQRSIPDVEALEKPEETASISANWWKPGTTALKLSICTRTGPLLTLK